MLPALRKVLSSPLAQSLTTPHGVDGYLQAVNPTWSVNEVRARVINVRRDTADSVTLTLRPNGNWQGFKAGQYVRLTVEINGVRRTRCYSPANSAHDNGLIELTTKAQANGFVSKYLREQAASGLVVTLSQADGVFALPAERPQNILLISGGSGITPVMSMLRTLIEEGHKGRITFLHYASRAQDMIYANELATLSLLHPNLKLVRTFGEAGGELQGLFCREHLLSAAPEFNEAETFLCGPPGLMQSVQKLYADAGLSHRLHLEHFTAAAPIIAPISGKAEGEVRFARSERLATNNGASLLDQAEAAGLKPEAGCRMGICHSCTCRKTSGRVRDLRNGQISDAGEEDIQICVTVPLGTVTLDL